MKKLILTVSFISISASMFAGGFRISIQGVKQAAMAHTGVASTTDASATFFNPAGLARQEKKWSVSANVFGVQPTAKHQDREFGYEQTTDNPVGTPFGLYVSHKLSDKLVIGLGIYTPYGNTVTWGDEWAGQAIIRDISLRAYFIQPTVAYKLNDWASIGAGLIYAKGAVEINRAFVASGNVELKSDKASGLGYNLGLMINPSEKVAIGVNYRSKVAMNAEGDAYITSNQGASLANDRWEAELPLAAELTFGVSYKPIEKLTLNYDMNYTFWDAYESLDFDFNGVLPDSSSKRNYENTMTYRIGLAYDVLQSLTLRLGAYYDETPSPDEYFSPETPTLDTRALTGGLSYRFKNGVSIDASYLYLNGKERNFTNVETNFKGDVRSHTHIVGLGTSFNF